MAELRSRTPFGELEVEKRALRQRMLSLRTAVSAARAREVGARVAAYAVESAAFRAASSIAVYAATDGEPDLQELFSRGRAAAKSMLLPRCEADGRLAFCVVERWQDLSRGRYGLLEPVRSAPRVESASIDLVFAPSIAVDDRGVRLGRGGGWYDRSFAGPRDGAAILVAVIHAFQRVERVPGGESDRAVDGYVSELGLTWTSGRAPDVATRGRGGDSRGR